MAGSTKKRVVKNNLKVAEVPMTLDHAFARLITRVALGEISSAAVAPILCSLRGPVDSIHLENTRKDLQIMVGRLRSALSDLADAVNRL